MPSMKVTVNAAMRARDVSRPQPQHEAAAEEQLAAARPAPSPRARIGPPLTRGNGPARPPMPPAPPSPGLRPAPPGDRPAGTGRPKPGAGIPGPPRHRESGQGPRPAREPATAGEPRAPAGPGAPREQREQREPAPAPEVARPGAGQSEGGKPRAGQPGAGQTEAGQPVARQPGAATGGTGQKPKSGAARPGGRKRVRRRRSHGR